MSARQEKRRRREVAKVRAELVRVVTGQEKFRPKPVPGGGWTGRAG